MMRLQKDRTAALEMAEFKKRVVWGRAHIVPSHDPALYRMDDHGFWIRYGDYGNCLSEHGWVFGPDLEPGAPLDPGDITRLRPVNWRNMLLPGGLMSHETRPARRA